MESKHEWCDGTWVKAKSMAFVTNVKGETASLRHKATYDFPDTDFEPTASGTWSYGKFSDTNEKIRELTAASHYNIKMVYMGGKVVEEGVLSENGKTIHSMTFDGKNVEIISWVDQDQLQKNLNEREHYLNPSTFYKIEPENQGKIVFISGPPGAGKSTCGAMLAKSKDFIYYEVDALLNLANPYIPLESDTALGFQMQPALKGFSREMVKTTIDFYTGVLKGHIDDGVKDEFYRFMTNHIKHEKARIGGGHWALAFAVAGKKDRDVIKTLLGPDCIFITLTLSEEALAQRVDKRYGHMDEQTRNGLRTIIGNLAKWFEPASESEENAWNILITPEMSVPDVVEKIMDLL